MTINCKSKIVFGIFGLFLLMISVSAVRAQCATQPSGLVSWWNGDSVTGTNVIDLKGNNNGTLYGGATTAAGFVGNALQFDGINDYFSSNGYTGIYNAAPRTMAFWAKCDDPTRQGGQIILGQGPDGDFYTDIIPTYRFYTYSNKGQNLAFDTGVTADTNWHFIAITFANNHVEYYIDGVRSGTGIDDAALTNDWYFLIGKRGDNTQPLFKGKVDEVQLYNQALTAGEVSAIYNAGSSGVCNEAPPICGDGQINQQSEQCDGADFGSVTCTSILGNSYGGPLTCLSDCSSFSTASCFLDIDHDGASDSTDNCLTIYNPDQLNSDSQDGGDVCDVCAYNSTDTCNQQGSAGEYMTASTGGTLTTPNAEASISVPAGALSSDASMSITQNSIPPANVYIGTNGPSTAKVAYSFTPDGAVFNSPVTVTLQTTCTTNCNKLHVSVRNPDGTWTDLGGTCTNVNTLYTCVAQTIHFSEFAIVAPVDSDGDGIADNWFGESDDCPNTAGSVQYYGCTGGAINAISTEKISNSALTSELLAACGGASKCTTPIYEGKAGVTSMGAKLYNEANLLSLLGTRTIPLDQLCSIYDSVGFNSALATPNIKKADSTGKYGFGLSAVSGTYSLIESVTEVVGGISNRVCILETIIPRNFNANVATREVNLISTTSRDTRNGLLVKKSAGHTSVITGSELKITYPEYFEWSGDEELYPFFFESDSDWSVDVCAQVPSGYQIVAVQDENGNVISTSECVQAGVAGEMKVVLFRVADVGSPADFEFKTKIKTTHKGKITSLDIDIPSKNRKAGAANGRGVTGRAIDISDSGNIGWVVAVILFIVLVVILLRRKRKR